MDRRARLLKLQLHDRLLERSPVLAYSVRMALPSSTLVDDMHGRTLVLRYGPGANIQAKRVQQAAPLLAEELTALSDPDRPTIGLRVERVGVE